MCIEKTCWASSTCKKVGECSQVCPAYVLLRALYAQSNMPTVYRHDITLQVDSRDKETFEYLRKYMDEVVSNVDGGKGLYLWGRNTGTGKTTVACRIMNLYFRKMVFKSNLDALGVYINVPTFMEDIRESYGEGKEIKPLKDRLLKARLAIFDDIGSEKPSPWVKERLYTYINERVGEGLTNIFTSNLPIKELESEEILGRRITSRIYGCTTQLEFKGADRRKVGG